MPSKIDSISKDTIKLSIHKSYHRTSPKIQKLSLLALDQGSAMKKALSGNVHDLSSFPLSGMEDVFKQGQDISTVIADTWIIGFNSRKAPFSNLKVRRAFKASIDNEAFRQKFNFASNNPDNFSGIKDNIIDSLLEKARGLQDRIKRYKVYKKLAARVNDLALTANLFHSRPHY